MIYLKPSNNIYPIERILSAATYLSSGFVGFIWLIIASLMKKRITPFLMYHIFQSIFLSIAYFILVKLSQLVYVILYRIPLINAIPYYLNMPLPLFYNLSLIQLITSLIILYLAITAFMGQYSYIPYVSNIIDRNVGRK